MDQRITQPSAVLYFPWTLDVARLPGARQSDENGSSDGDVGIKRAKEEGRKRENCVSLTFLDSSVHLTRFSLFLHEKIRMSRLPVAARRKWKERRTKKKARSANSIRSHVARGRRRQLRS